MSLASRESHLGNAKHGGRFCPSDRYLSQGGTMRPDDEPTRIAVGTGPGVALMTMGNRPWSHTSSPRDSQLRIDGDCASHPELECREFSRAAPFGRNYAGDRSCPPLAIDLADVETIWRVLLFLGCNALFLFASHRMQRSRKLDPESALGPAA